MSTADSAMDRLQDLEEMVDSILEQYVRPQLASHAGDIKLEEVTEDGVVVLSWHGACRGCPLQPVTTASTLWTNIEPLPGVSRIDAGWRSSDDVEQRLRRTITEPLLDQAIRVDP